MNYIFNTYDTASKLQYKDIAKHETTTSGRIKSTVSGKLQVQLSLIHKVEGQDRDNFLAFYNTNKNSIVDVIYGGVVYSLNFSSNPLFTPLNGDFWKITVKLTGLA